MCMATGMTQSNLQLSGEKKVSGTSALVAWLPVIAFMLLAVIVRWRMSSAANYYLLAGSDGPYYPLQVRVLMEYFKLGYPDVPLMFMIDALLAKGLLLWHVGSPGDCILMAVRLTDSLLPPLAAIPAFLIAKELRVNNGHIGFPAYLMVAFAILNPATLVMFPNSILHKNAVAVIWIFFYLFFLIRIPSYHLKRDFYVAVFLLLLCALTHFGSFVLLLLFTGLSSLVWLLNNETALLANSAKKLGIASVIISLLLCITAYFDFERFRRLINIPLKLFEGPVLLFLLNGQSSYINLLSLKLILAVNLLSLFALFILIRRRKTIDRTRKVVAWSMLLASFFLSSPFIGLEWANRLYMMSYVPLTLLYLVIFNAFKTRWVKVIPIIVFTGLIYIALMISLFERPRLSITNEAFVELDKIKSRFQIADHSLLLGRQDLRLLGSWLFRTKGMAGYLLTAEDFKQYDAIYMIRQMKGSNLPLPRFREPVIPSGALLVYNSEFFQLYRLVDSTGLEGRNRRPSRVRGLIVRIEGNRFVVLTDNGSRSTIEVSKATNVHLLSSAKQFSSGMNVEVWGDWKPFSLTIAADVINETAKLN